jgi:hypothetical protein
MGEGQLAPLFKPLAEALRADNYGGVISFESVYHPGNGDFEAGFRQNIRLIQRAIWLGYYIATISQSFDFVLLIRNQGY